LSSNEELTNLELEVFLESKKKTIDEIARALNLERSKVSSLLESALKKMPRAQILEPPPTAILPRPIFKLEKKIGEIQVGTMKVGSQIVELLSKGIYSAAWNSLKELVSNSFDADAKKVEISYVPEEKKLVIHDDGLGMDYEDFNEHFTFIVRSLKREKGLLTPIFKRPIIGKIGIGFIAVSELCDVIKITTAKKGSDTLAEAVIDFSKMRGREAKYKEFYEISQYTFTNYLKEDADKHFTTIELLNLKQPFIDILENKPPAGSAFPSLKVKSFEDFLPQLGNWQTKDIRAELGLYWEFLLNFAAIIPVEYVKNGPLIETKRETINDALLKDYTETIEIIKRIKLRLESFNFKVFFNGLELKKPFCLPNQSEIKQGRYGRDYRFFPIQKSIQVINKASEGKSQIVFEGYFFYQRTRIIPQQMRGMIVRIKNVAIGGPNFDFWGHPYVGDDIYFPQTFGELYFESGLEDAMNIDRSTFKTSHHEYAATKEVIHKFLRSSVFSAAKKMWSIRKSEKAENEDTERTESRKKTVRKRLGEQFDIRETRKFSGEPVKLDVPDRNIELNVISDPFQGFEKRDRLLLQDVAMALEMSAAKAHDMNELKKIFWEILREMTEYRRI